MVLYAKLTAKYFSRLAIDVLPAYEVQAEVPSLASLGSAYHPE